MSSARKRTTPTRLKVPAGGATVRMYCTGLGDCYLIGLPKGSGKVGYVLIDCGVYQSTPGAREWMTRIMQHIQETVGPAGIDILVVSHPHWDHISGFQQAQEVFDTIPVQAVWLSWTEDETDPMARGLAQQRQFAIRAAAAATQRLRALAADPAQGWQQAEVDRALATAESIDNLLQFSGYSAAETALAAAKIDDVLKSIKTRVDRPKYLKPSRRPIRFSQFPDVKIYALGPPTDPKLLGQDNPSTVPGKSEVYATAGLAIPLNEVTALCAAAEATPSEEPSEAPLKLPYDKFYPCEEFYRIPIEQAGASEHGDFFRRHYGLDGGDPQLDWRRIDTDWLEAAAQLALDLDHHVNNTCLVLAFELGSGEDAPVLLFAGDAQVGNWLSWHQLDRDGSFARDLLARTVLYKVGHHGSHNATLKAKGLELMTDRSRLVAMLPVDEAEAHKPKGSNKDGWSMPYDQLLQALKTRTEGRVMRADQGVPLLDEDDKPQGWSQAKWRQFCEDTVVETADVVVNGQTITKPLFIQYTVRG